jgi:hypothetical protein
VTTTIEVRSWTTHEVVHTFKTDYPQGSSQFDRMLSGLYRKVDLARYYVHLEDDK